MRAWVAVICVLVSCGRIGFDGEPRGSDDLEGSSLDDAAPLTDEGETPDGQVPAATCSYQACAGGDVSCCESGTTICKAASACTGLIIQCDDKDETACGDFRYCCNFECIFVDTPCAEF